MMKPDVRRDGDCTGSACGFTLIELMITVAIVGVLASIAIPKFSRYIRRARTVEATEAVHKIANGTLTYYQNHGFMPCADNRLDSDGIPTGSCAGGQKYNYSYGVPWNTICARGGRADPGDVDVWFNRFRDFWIWQNIQFHPGEQPRYEYYYYGISDSKMAYGLVRARRAVVCPPDPVRLEYFDITLRKSEGSLRKYGPRRFETP